MQAAHGEQPAPFSPMHVESGTDPIEVLRVFSKGEEGAEEMRVNKEVSELLSSKLPLHGITRRAK